MERDVQIVLMVTGMMTLGLLAIAAAAFLFFDVIPAVFRWVKRKIAETSNG